jgi:hypothetical protein
MSCPSFVLEQLGSTRSGYGSDVSLQNYLLNLVFDFFILHNKMPIYKAIRQRSIMCQINWVLYLTVHMHPSRRGEYVFVLLDYSVHLLLLGRETWCIGFGSWSDLSFTFRPNHIEKKSPSLRNHVSALLHRDQRDCIIWDCL